MSQEGDGRIFLRQLPTSLVVLELLAMMMSPVSMMEGLVERDVVIAGNDDLDFELGFTDPIESLAQLGVFSTAGEITGMDQDVAGGEFEGAIRRCVVRV